MSRQPKTIPAELCKLIEEFVQDLQRRGYTKYATTMEVKVEYELTYDQAYYRVRKYWGKK